MPQSIFLFDLQNICLISSPQSINVRILVLTKKDLVLTRIETKSQEKR